MAGGLPTGAKQPGERRGDLDIEAREVSSLDTRSKREAGEDTDLVVIQFDGPIEEEWKVEVEDIGVELGDYLPDYSFIAKLSDKKDHKQLKHLPFVKSVAPFYPVNKVAPTLRKALGTTNEVEVAVIGFDQHVDMRRTLHRAAGEELAGKVDSLKEAKHISLARMSGEGLEEIIQSEDVIAVVPLPKRKLHNDRAAKIIKANKLEASGFSGRGQIIGIADSGLDTGDLDNLHPDFQGRVKSLYAIGRKDDASDPDGHGTHVAGSALGSGEASDGQYQGMAPEAELVFHSMLTKKGYLEGEVKDILGEAYEDGARIHADSWGTDDNGNYGLDSYLFDQFLWAHKDMTALVAAGNQGDLGYKTIGSPATAKNVIAVGATENDRPDVGGKEADDPDTVAGFSSRGTTKDGRLKPDIVAPGSYILSARSSVAPEDEFEALFDDYYAYNSGTSMATPILAGGAAQLRQFLLEEKELDEPSAALIKAMLISGADDLDEDMRLQGFGRANLLQAIETDFVDEKEGLITGEEATFAVEVTDRTKPLAITLAWTDYPASPAAKKALVNNLDMTVTAPSGERFNGNDFFRYPYDDEVDNLNNVEQVWISRPEEGLYTVNVKGFNIPKGPQPFAIATTGKFVEKGGGNHIQYGELNDDKRINRFDDYAFHAESEGRLRIYVDWNNHGSLSLTLYGPSGDILAIKDLKKRKNLVFPLPEKGRYKIRLELEDGPRAPYKLSMSYPE
ncbi:S8 family serine peptidase [Brevibacillus borstelensis]